MKNRTEALRRRIETHRYYLAVGGDIELMRLMLRDIAGLEAELAHIEKAERKQVEARESQPSISSQRPRYL